MRLHSAVAVIALLAGGAVPEAGAAAPGSDSPDAATAAKAPGGCTDIRPSKVTTDKDGAKTYEFRIPDRAGVEGPAETGRYNTLTQVLPPPGFNPATASDAQLQKYQYPAHTYASPAARQKFFAKSTTRHIGVTTCASKGRDSAADSPNQAPSAEQPTAAAANNCTPSPNTDRNFLVGYAGCASGGLKWASTVYRVPTLEAGCSGIACGNAIWAGLGGFNIATNGFFQAGTISTPPPGPSDGSQFMFTQFVGKNLTGNSNVLLDPLGAVAPGDDITATISYTPPIIPSTVGLFTFSVTNDTTFNLFTGVVPLLDSVYGLANNKSATAEVMVERPQYLIGAESTQLKKWNAPDIAVAAFTASTTASGSPLRIYPNDFASGDRFTTQMCATPTSTSCPTAAAQLASVPATPASNWRVTWRAPGGN